MWRSNLVLEGQNFVSVDRPRCWRHRYIWLSLTVALWQSRGDVLTRACCRPLSTLHRPWASQPEVSDCQTPDIPAALCGWWRSLDCRPGLNRLSPAELHTHTHTHTHHIGIRGVNIAPQTAQCGGGANRRRVKGALCRWEKEFFSSRP